MANQQIYFYKQQVRHVKMNLPQLLQEKALDDLGADDFIDIYNDILQGKQSHDEKGNVKMTPADNTTSSDSPKKDKIWADTPISSTVWPFICYYGQGQYLSFILRSILISISFSKINWTMQNF